MARNQDLFQDDEISKALRLLEARRKAAKAYAQRVAERERALGRKRRTFWLTDEETEKVRRFIEEIRGGFDDGGHGE